MACASALPMKPGEVKTYPTQVRRKGRQKPQAKEPRDRNDWLLRNGTPEQAAESARIARERQGERED